MALNFASLLFLARFLDIFDLARFPARFLALPRNLFMISPRSTYLTCDRYRNGTVLFEYIVGIRPVCTHIVQLQLIVL